MPRPPARRLRTLDPWQDFSTESLEQGGRERKERELEGGQLCPATPGSWVHVSQLRRGSECIDAETNTPLPQDPAFRVRRIPEERSAEPRRLHLLRPRERHRRAPVPKAGSRRPRPIPAGVRPCNPAARRVADTAASASSRARLRQAAHDPRRLPESRSRVGAATDPADPRAHRPPPRAPLAGPPPTSRGGQQPPNALRPRRPAVLAAGSSAAQEGGPGAREPERQPEPERRRRLASARRDLGVRGLTAPGLSFPAPGCGGGGTVSTVPPRPPTSPKPGPVEGARVGGAATGTGGERVRTARARRRGGRRSPGLSLRLPKSPYKHPAAAGQSPAALPPQELQSTPAMPCPLPKASPVLR